MLGKEGIEHVRQTPRIIRRIKNEVIADPSVVDVGEAVGIILEDEQFALTECEQDIYEKAIPKLQRAKNAAAHAHSLPIDDLVSNWPRSQDIRTDAVIIHPTSVTIAYTSERFEANWKKAAPDEPIPYGFTSILLKKVINGFTLPYSLRDAEKSTLTTATHENDHVEYRYFHPDSSHDFPDNDAIEHMTRSYVDAGSYDGFGEFVEDMEYAHMNIFLDELTASTPKRRGILPLFTNSSESYRKRYEKRRTAMQKGMPDDIVERAPWERIIFLSELEENQARSYLDAEFQQLIAANTPNEDIQDIITSLTPETGYLIRLFTSHTGSDPTRDEILNWYEEYNLHSSTDTDPQSAHQTWALFLDKLARERQQTKEDPASYRHKFLEGIMRTMPFTEYEKLASEYIRSSISAGNERNAIYSRLFPEYVAKQPGLTAEDLQYIRDELADLEIDPDHIVADTLLSVDYYRRHRKIPDAVGRDILVQVAQRALDVDDIQTVLSEAIRKGIDITVDTLDDIKESHLLSDWYEEMLDLYIYGPDEVDLPLKNKIMYEYALTVDDKEFQEKYPDCDLNKLRDQQLRDFVRLLLYAKTQGFDDERVREVREYFTWRLTDNAYALTGLEPLIFRSGLAQDALDQTKNTLDLISLPAANSGPTE